MTTFASQSISIYIMYKDQDLDTAFFTTLFTQLYVGVGILFTYRKHLYDRIISHLRKDGCI